MNETIRVRFAPSPTGHLHIGSVRTALFNWLLARHENGTFILRIEDTDQERNKPEYLDAVISDLEWLGLNWDEGPYFQSKRLPIYQKYVDTLLKQEKAYLCYCTAEELSQKRERAQKEKRNPGYDGTCRKLSIEAQQSNEKLGRKSIVRFRVPEQKKLIVQDLIRGNVDFSNDLIEDFAIMKSDGFPLYNFACAIDDHEMSITHVLRGEEHLSNTPRQLLIYQAFNWPIPHFGHLSIILDEQRKKLSKREGATYISEFKDEGFLPETIINFVALLGWARKDDLEILPLPEIIHRFGFDGMIKSPAVFDLKKLEWMNGEYIKELSTGTLTELLIPFLQKAGFSEKKFTGEKKKWLSSLVELFHERIRTLKEFPKEAEYFLSEKIEPSLDEIKKLKTHQLSTTLETLASKLETIDFSQEKLEPMIREFAEKEGVKAAEIIHPLRLLLTGRKVSPGIFAVMELLGREASVKRIKEGVLSLKNNS